MTALLDVDTAVATADDGAPRFASWQARAGAIALDVLPGVGVITTMALLAYTTAVGGWLWWVFMGVLAAAALATFVNRWLLPPITGWTMGRAVTRIRVVTATGQPAGSTRLLIRELAHLLDTAALFVGWLWPLGDKRHRTFADLLLRTEVRVVDSVDHPRRNVRRIAGCVLIAAAVLCVAGGGLGYLQVYRQDRALEQARAEIAEQGPRIVEQLLSYGTKSVVDDFARAQALATDGYRPQLVAQQQAVQKSGVTDNEYWAVSSAVLPDPTPTMDRAAMLLALQGQRGSDPNSLKFITATVRADFEKSNGRWQVAVLTVLKKPLTGQNGGPQPPQPPSPPQNKPPR
ncbi:RDD family protein [Mycolicibacterium hodleri]|uniref:RDD family protein n=1 Tax=Mycolicibacterium hodleri TaxID=49897 RepID=A0A502EFB0_9MYCO|nr:RDD family protein [Mycolicibacterium hodleri]TPG35190.1 RDD family protein [Mycolicibacterium hodleri]